MGLSLSHDIENVENDMDIGLYNKIVAIVIIFCHMILDEIERKLEEICYEGKDIDYLTTDANETNDSNNMLLTVDFLSHIESQLDINEKVRSINQI